MIDSHPVVDSGAQACALAIGYETVQNRTMLLTKRERPVLIVNLLNVSIFTVVALGRSNVEFLLYIGVILVVMAWILVKQRSVQFDLAILWGLTIWGMMHLAGGNLRANGDSLYSLELLPLMPRLNILRYDQVVHMFGFGVATLVCYHLLKPYLRAGINRKRTLLVLVALMGCGIGAINEIIEFLVVQIVPETGVGGYENTMLDLIFNLLGGVLAVTWIALGRRPALPGPTRIVG